MHEGRPILEVAGYDRPQRKLFLLVFRCQENVLAAEDEIVYDSLYEPEVDWTDIGMLTEKFSKLEICVPKELIETVYFDQRFNAGNTVVEHYVDQTPETKAAD